MKIKFRKIVIFLLVVLVLYPTISLASEPVYEIVICFNKTRFNPGENITFNLYFAGVGAVTEDHLLFYVNDDIYIEKLLEMGIEITSGLNDEALNVQAISGILSDLNSLEGYNPETLNPLFAMDRNLSLPPYQVTLGTKDYVHSGEHDLKVVYTYKDEDGNWHQTTDTKTFHVTTEVEQVEYEFMINEQQMGELNTMVSSFQVVLAISAIIISVFSSASVIIIHKEKNKTINIMKEINIETKKGKNE